MKNIFYIASLLLLLGFAVSCDDEQDDLVTSNVVTGGLLDIRTPLLSHVKGERPTYTLDLLVYQGEVKTTEVELYKQFQNADGITDRQPMKTVAVENQSSASLIAIDFTYDELADGVPGVPEDDADLVVGDKFIISYKAKTSEGNAHWNAPKTEVGVSSPFAGVYTVIASDYWRIGVQSGAADWTGQDRVVKSISPTVLKHEGWGPWLADVFPGDPMYLYLESPDESAITILTEWEGELLRGPGDTPIGCETHPNAMVNVPCTDTNFMEFRENGKHLITLSYGYEIVGSGFREFYEVLEKQVD